MAAPAPLGVYVHWPYCERICPYCDFNVRRARGRTSEAAALAAAILADLEAQAKALGPRRLASIFFGGGTPSLAPPAFVAALIERACALFPAADAPEVTLEANPAQADPTRLADFRDAGVDRLSLGIQSLDDRVLAFLGRDHDAAAGRAAAERAGAIFSRLSVDLIYALPGQTPTAWRSALGEALRLAPEHVSAYQLTIEAKTAFGVRARRGQLATPDAGTAAELFEVTQETLAAAGFDAYEISNHARGDAARSGHNLHAWRGGEYLGLGPGAHGRFDRGGVRFASLAPNAPAAYIARVAERGLGAALTPLSPRERAIERLIMGLRIADGVVLADLAPMRAAPQVVADLVGDGLLLRQGDRIAIAPGGRLVADRLTAVLAEALEPTSEAA